MSYGQGQYQSSGYATAQILYPNNHGIRGEMKNRGVQPRNHLQDYKMQLKEMQKENRRRKQRDAYETSKKPHVLKQFASVTSRVNQTGHKKGAAPTVQKKPLQEKKNFVRNNRTHAFDKKGNHFAKKDTVKRRVKISKDAHDTLALLTGSYVPPKEDQFAAPAIEEKEIIDYVAQNKAEAAAAAKPAPVAKKPAPKHKSYGKVPQYLKKRKAVWEAEERQERAEMAKRAECPPGMQLMPESERLETLRVLKANKDGITAKLTRLPIIIDTLSLRNRKAALEKQMSEVEDAIKVFSRKKVFIAE